MANLQMGNMMWRGVGEKMKVGMAVLVQRYSHRLGDGYKPSNPIDHAKSQS